MIHFLLLALAPWLVCANGISEWQKPLPKHPGAANCGRGRKGLHFGSAFSFSMNGDWRYYFNDYFLSDGHCHRGELTRLDMGVLDDISNHIAPPKPQSDIPPRTKLKKKVKPPNKGVSLMITIPLDTEASGPLIIEPEPQWKLFHQMDKSIDILWTDSRQPGRDLNITSIGIRQESTTSAKTSHVRIALDTPFLRLPNDMYDYLFVSTRPQRVDMGRGLRAVDIVNCDAVSGFPDIVLEFEEGVQELVVRPEQYVLRVREAMGGQFVGKCILLAARGDGDVAVGWAAIRGTTVWFDWANARTGFGVAVKS